MQQYNEQLDLNGAAYTIIICGLQPSF